MNNACISYSSKNRLELTKRTIAPLLPQKGWDLWWYDASTEPGAAEFFNDRCNETVRAQRLHGGSCRYIVAALTQMLGWEDPRYDYVGLCENDVLLDDDWFEPTMALFYQTDGGVHPGAVSARTYEDRILIQRDGYAVMHNLG